MRAGKMRLRAASSALGMTLIERKE